MDSDTSGAIALAHLRLPVSDLDGAIGFFEAIGARPDVRRGNFAVVELRDRTRLQLTETGEAIPAGRYLQFDFKVEDIDLAWREYQARGLSPGEIVRRRPGHDSFLLQGPDGCEVKINSGFNRE